MKAIVTNYGRSQAFPTCIGNIFLERCRPRDGIKDKDALRELSKFHHVEVKVEDGSLEGNPVDYSKYSINELRNFATQAGIKRSFFMKKRELIEKLEEKNGISTCVNRI